MSTHGGTTSHFWVGMLSAPGPVPGQDALGTAGVRSWAESVPFNQDVLIITLFKWWVWVVASHFSH